MTDLSAAAEAARDIQLERFARPGITAKAVNTIPESLPDPTTPAERRAAAGTQTIRLDPHTATIRIEALDWRVATEGARAALIAEAESGHGGSTSEIVWLVERWRRSDELHDIIGRIAERCNRLMLNLFKPHHDDLEHGPYWSRASSRAAEEISNLINPDLANGKTSFLDADALFRDAPDLANPNWVNRTDDRLCDQADQMAHDLGALPRVHAIAGCDLTPGHDITGCTKIPKITGMLPWLLAFRRALAERKGLEPWGADTFVEQRPTVSRHLLAWVTSDATDDTRTAAAEWLIYTAETEHQVMLFGADAYVDQLRSQARRRDENSLAVQGDRVEQLTEALAAARAERRDTLRRVLTWTTDSDANLARRARITKQGLAQIKNQEEE